MITSTSSRRNGESNILIPDYQDEMWKQQAMVFASNVSYMPSRRSEQAHVVDLNVYPSVPGSLTTLGSAVIQIVGSGSLTKGLIDAGLPVSCV
jgi:hypothetical protein